MKRTVGTTTFAIGVFAASVACSGQEKAGPSAKEVRDVVGKAVEFLASKQTKEGSFAPKIAGPGVSGLVVAGLLRNGVSAKEPVMANTIAYLEKQVRPDGGIYNKVLANYTTSVAVMAFHEANADAKYDTILKNAANFLKGIQHEEDSVPTFGGFGYDGKKRPDLSNTNFALEALLAAGVPKNDPAVQKALKFIGRCQNLPGEFNDQKFAQKTSKDDLGGFVYNPLDKDDSPHRTPDGGLRSMGGMTYGGLKSFLYAGVSKQDPRVKAAVSWMRRHYTLDENPGMGQAGLYYYYHTFAKALDALGEDSFADARGTKHAWRAELFSALKKRQNEDGSWRNTGDKTFGEASPELATAFAVLTLSYVRPAAASR